MKASTRINEKIEEVLDQVGSVTDNLYGRVRKINFEEASMSAGSLDDLKLHLGYTKNYSDLAKVRLQYLKYE